MKVALTLIFLFLFGPARAQCFELLSEKLDSVSEIPYGLHEKAVYEIQAGKTVSLKISDVKYKSKFAFLFQWHDLGDTIDVALVTLNWKTLARKTMTKADYILRYEPFKKSENYFLIVTTRARLDPNKRPMVGCLGLAILERLTERPFKQIQRIEWKAGVPQP
jgi:hypothetical protein